ncbi:MAG: hypothetical protein J6Y96_00450 [Mycoplasma sp.]|nr:hypothetical protein [Mycoplasma sp.]
MNKDILNRIIRIAKEQKLKVDLSVANKDKTLKELGLDSLSVIGVIVKLENELKIYISDETLGKIQTLDQLVNAIEETLNNK